VKLSTKQGAKLGASQKSWGAMAHPAPLKIATAFALTLHSYRYIQF